MRKTLLACLVLGGCAFGSTPLAQVVSLETALDGIDVAAAAYVSQPRCDATHTTLCSDDAVVAKISTDRQSAYDSVTKAEALAKDPTTPAATFQAAISDAQLKVQTLSADVPPK